jgi:hypothetical protein
MPWVGEPLGPCGLKGRERAAGQLPAATLATFQAAGFDAHLTLMRPPVVKA